MNRHLKPSRRDVLKGGGALVVSFSLASRMDEALAQAGASARPLALTEVDAFLAIDGKGMCTVYSGKVDLGTGIATALRQIAALTIIEPGREIHKKRLDAVKAMMTKTPG